MPIERAHDAALRFVISERQQAVDHKRPGGIPGKTRVTICANLNR